MFSHHDLLVSSCYLPSVPEVSCDTTANLSAPRVPNLRFKTKWSDDGVIEYGNQLSPLLLQIRETWGNIQHTNSSISLLLSTTFSAMNIAAKSTNKVSMLGIKLTIKPKKNKEVQIISKSSHKLLRALSRLEANPTATQDQLLEARHNLHESRMLFKKCVREGLAEERDTCDSKHYNIISNPSAAFRAFRAGARNASPSVKKMHVRDKVYLGESVPDGMYDSLSSLKAPEMSQFTKLPPYVEALSVYQHIINLASAGGKIPPISFPKGEKLLHGLKSSVIDYFSVTSLHFLHLGPEGIQHFIFLFNTVIEHVNSSSIEEINTIWANILVKGGPRDLESDRSYRTISCCPLLAKAIDTYMVELYQEGWSAAQASTQFQGSNSSHELASLSITEAVSHGMQVNKEAVYLLLLDAESAYDRVIIEHAIRAAYDAGTVDEGLLYLNHRLRNRRTFIEWNKEIMGPIRDTMGVEQGGVASDKIYRLVNNIQLKTAQQSELEVNLGRVVTTNGTAETILSSVGQSEWFEVPPPAYQDIL